MQKDAAYMKLIEEISLNAWPSHKIELYDGWLIRSSSGLFQPASVTEIPEGRQCA